MKKKYTEPTIAIFTVNVNQIVAASSVKIDNDASASDEYEVDGYNNDARENNIFDNNHSIWDNAW